MINFMKQLSRVALCLSVFAGSQCLLAGNTVFDVKPGMKVKTFNQLKIAEKRIKRQRIEKAKSSMGVSDLPTTIQNKFFASKNPFWKRGMIRIQNNRILKFSMFQKNASPKLSEKVFNDFLDLYGTSFSAHPFKSFGKEGVSFEWQVDERIVSISYLAEKQGRWSYHLDVYPTTNEMSQKPFLNLNSPQVRSVLMALGADTASHSENVAIQTTSPLDDELDALLQ